MRRQCQFTVKRSAMPPKCAAMSIATTTATASASATTAATASPKASTAVVFVTKILQADQNYKDQECKPKHNNPMRRQCQFTVKRSERSVDLTVTAEQQPCGVQVVEGVGLSFLSLLTLCLRPLVECFPVISVSFGIPVK